MAIYLDDFLNICVILIFQFNFSSIYTLTNVTNNVTIKFTRNSYRNLYVYDINVI